MKIKVYDAATTKFISTFVAFVDDRGDPIITIHGR